MQEDVLDILLNLKDLALKMHSRDSASLSLKKKGPGPVFASDIEFARFTQPATHDCTKLTFCPLSMDSRPTLNRRRNERFTDIA